MFCIWTFDLFCGIKLFTFSLQRPWFFPHFKTQENTHCHNSGKNGTFHQSSLWCGCRLLFGQSMVICGHSLIHQCAQCLSSVNKLCFLIVACTLSNHMLFYKLRSIWRSADNFVQEQDFCTAHSQVSRHSCRLCSVWWNTEPIWDTVWKHLGTGIVFFAHLVRQLLTRIRNKRKTSKNDLMKRIYYEMLAFLAPLK